MNSDRSFWSKGFNRAVVYGIGLLILFGSYVIDTPDNKVQDENSTKKTKLSAIIQDSPLDEINPTAEQEEQLPVRSVTSTSVSIGPSKQDAKPNATAIAAHDDSISVLEYTADEICDELTGTDVPAGRYMNMFIGAVDSTQNLKSKEFISFPISTETTLAKIFAVVPKPEGLDQKWQAYKLCNTNKCGTGKTSIARGDWSIVPSLESQTITNGDVYALMYPSAKLPVVDCIAKTE